MFQYASGWSTTCTSKLSVVRKGLIDIPDKERLNFIVEESNKILVKAQARLEALEYIPSGLQ